MDKLASQIIIEILQNEMSLLADSIWIRDQNRKIPNDDEMYIIVGMTDSIALSTNSRVYYDDPDVKEETSVNIKENIQIDIFSRSNDAILRRWEVLAAMKSLYCVQQQEKYGFKISRLHNSFVNSSIAEGGSQLNRYSITLGCMVWYKKERVLSGSSQEYYDEFSTRVDDEETIENVEGLIEFTIDESTEL